MKFLSDRQKRANHIASEQKRRNSIRDGFKEMQDMVPGLLKSHHSKSTILFKAVHYIRRLDRRNQSLREKLLRLREKQAGKISYDSISIPMTEDIPHTPPPLLKFASIVNIHTSHSPDAMVIPAFETWSIPPTRLDEHLLSLKRKQSIFQ